MNLRELVKAVMVDNRDSKSTIIKTTEETGYGRIVNWKVYPNEKQHKEAYPQLRAFVLNEKFRNIMLLS